MSPDQLNQIQDQLADIQRSVGRIEGTVTANAGTMAAQGVRITDNEGRICQLENRQHWYSGAAAMLGAIAGAFGSHLRT
jgi:hypothetical protein